MNYEMLDFNLDFVFQINTHQYSKNKIEIYGEKIMIKTFYCLTSNLIRFII